MGGWPSVIPAFQPVESVEEGTSGRVYPGFEADKPGSTSRRPPQREI